MQKEDVIMITTCLSADPVETYKKENKLVSLTKEEIKLDIDILIKTKEVKYYNKNLKVALSNMKKIHSIVYGKCTDGVQSLLNTEEDFKEKA